MAKITPEQKEVVKFVDKTLEETSPEKQTGEGIKTYEEAEDRSLPALIGNGITKCMRDRKQHRAIELEIDEWFKQLPVDATERNKQIAEAKKQMETAKQAIETFFIRFKGVAVGYRGTNENQS